MSQLSKRTFPHLATINQFILPNHPFFNVNECDTSMLQCLRKQSATTRDSTQKLGELHGYQRTVTGSKDVVGINYVNRLIYPRQIKNNPLSSFKQSSTSYFYSHTESMQVQDIMLYHNVHKTLPHTANVQIRQIIIEFLSYTYERIHIKLKIILNQQMSLKVSKYSSPHAFSLNNYQVIHP